MHTTIQYWLAEFGSDLIALLASAALLVAYYFVHGAQVRRDPNYSIIFVNDLARRLWVEQVMGHPGKDVMAVQTLRNFIMYPIMMASTATLLIIGTLTLSGQTENIARNWHVINVAGSHAAELWIFKIIFLLADFLVAFFAYAMAIRLANHVLFMLNVPKEAQTAHVVLTPANVARRLNRAGYLMAIGMRAYIFAIPLVFWLFGPLFLVLATAGTIGILARIDRHHDSES